MPKFLSTRRNVLTGAVSLASAGAAMAAPIPGAVPSGARTKVGGSVTPGFEGVQQAFERNIRAGMEIGAGFAVYRDGVPLINLWGGTTDESGSTPVTDRTLFTLMSTTKGMTSIAVARLVETGQLQYEAPVAKYWPEFAANGKSAFTVGELMSHQVGLTGPRQPVTMDDYYAHEPVAKLLAQQAPFFGPGKWGYHALTFGILADELVRRTDGRTVARFYTEDIKARLGLDAFMGLPDAEQYRAAPLVSAMDPSQTRFFDRPNPAAAAVASPPGNIDWGPDQQIARKHGFPASHGTASASALAKLYGHLVRRDHGSAPSLLSKSVFTEATRERIAGIDQCSGGLARYAAGFRLNEGKMGSNPASFGHPGWGGTVAFADPTRRLGIAYTTNRMLNPDWQWVDPRLASLLSALYAAEPTTRFQEES